MTEEIAITTGADATVATDQLSGGMHVQYVKLMNGTADSESIFKCDTTTSSFQVVEYEHHEIHSGSSFVVAYAEDLGNGATRDLLVTTPDTTKWAHMTLTVGWELEGHVYIYENPTISSDGTGVTAYNRNRNSATTATVVVTHTPTVGATGSTLIWQDHAGTGRTSGGEAHSQNEFVLKQNEQYLIRITNSVSNAANYITAHLDWYEHTNN